MFDKAAGLWLLIDTGAAVCVWPKKRFPQAQVDTTVKLQALNKSRFQTYGTQDIVFKINNKAYTHSVLIVDVDQPILGFDFIWRYKISIIWNRHGELDIVDMKSDVRAPLTVHKVPEGTSIKLAPVELEGQFKTFQQYAQSKNQAAMEKQTEVPIPKRCRDLLNRFPSIMKPDLKVREVKYGVVHTIETVSNKPVTIKVRPLLPGTEKTKQIEKNWRELEALGIRRKVPPEEVNTWTSALHSAPKPDGSLRVCPDFRPLNEKTILDGYPLPSLKHFTAKIRGATVFSRVDLVKVFHQIPLDKESQRQSTVVTPWGAWQFVRLSMGLRNSAQSCQC